MSLPPTMRTFVRDREIDIPFLSLERGCEGSLYHTPTPLEVAPYFYDGGDLLAYYGPEDGTQTWLCGTCAANLRVFFSLMRAMAGDVPWSVQREFGNTIRRIGKRMWGTDAS